MFIADTEDLRKLADKIPTLYHGEILGKHSDVVLRYSDWNVVEILSREAIKLVTEFHLQQWVNLCFDYQCQAEGSDTDCSASESESVDTQNLPP